LSSDGGGIAECFYYGDPCGMFLDKEWQEGEAHLVDGSAMTGSFRYNICGQKMEAIVEGDTFAFARPGELDKIRIADSRFVYCNYMRSDGELASSWFELLCKGNCSLMLRRYIKYRVTDGDEDHSNDLLYRIQEYYSCTGNNVLERLYLSKKDLMEKLKDHEREVAEYIKSERLNLKDHEDLVRIVDYYNNLD
ncbi:MAG TPA: hypothetical protein VK994_06255, partial [Bacteroidales bacterium]|nr:hypothetical protein [Bacteroidales bacterium]